jgi:catechol 2,3-dioxygenase-like lactoylglutathione lyase family enzyme
MYRITDPKRSRAFYEALGFRSRRELPIVRDGELEATNYFFGMPEDEAELELTFNHDGRPELDRHPAFHREHPNQGVPLEATLGASRSVVLCWKCDSSR